MAETFVKSKARHKPKTNGEQHLQGNGNSWGRNLGLPEYEMRAYLSRCAVRHRAGFEGSLSAIARVAWGICSECAMSFRLFFDMYALCRFIKNLQSHLAELKLVNECLRES
jgi:hypothetical protein